MNPVLEKIKDKKIALFVDNANWFYPQKELGWKISFSRLHAFLEKHCKIVILKLYAGTPLDNEDKKKFDAFRKAVEKAGFLVVTKPLKKILVDKEKKKFEHKCNFDVEIALDVARSIKEVDVIIIGSGDSDFLEVKKFSLENKKNFFVICFEKGVAWEMRKNYHVFLEEIKDEVKQKT